MRIALLPDDYLPDSTLVHAKMFHELAHELMKQGHDVVVITPGLPTQQSKFLVEYVDGVLVWRFRAGARRGNGVSKLQRAINESLLSFFAWRSIKQEVNKAPFDLCVNYSPTIFFGPLAAKLWKKYNTVVYLVLRDMFPQWAIDAGMIKDGSLITKYFRYIEHVNYKAANTIGLMSFANLKYFKNVNPQYKNVEVLHNWASLSPSVYNEYSINVRQIYNLEDKVIFFYGGNIGHAQDMENIVRLASGLTEYSRAHVLLVGQGDEFFLVEELIENLKLKNITLLSSVSQDKYKQLLTQVDVGLFSLAKTHTAHNFPGKLLGYMLQSLPVLGSVNPGNDLVEYINQSRAGFVYKNGEDKLLLDGAIMLLESEELRKLMGENSKNLLAQHFSVESAAQTILKTAREHA